MLWSLDDKTDHLGLVDSSQLSLLLSVSHMSTVANFRQLSTGCDLKLVISSHLSVCVLQKHLSNSQLDDERKD